MPLAPIESDVTAHLQLFLPAVPFTGERFWFGGQKSRRPRSKRTRASARILSFPYLKGHDFEGNFRTGWVPPRCIQLTTHVHDSSGETTNKEKPYWYLSVQNIFSKWLKIWVLVSTSRKPVRCLMIYCLPSERLRERQEVEAFGCSFPNPNQDALEAPHTSLQASA